YPTRTSTPWRQSESMSGIPSLTQNVSRLMRDRSRSLVDNNALASSILNRTVENVVGNGFQPQALTADGDWNKRAEALLQAWFPFADFKGRSFVQHQRIVCSALLRDGDVGGA